MTKGQRIIVLISLGAIFGCKAQTFIYPHDPNRKDLPRVVLDGMSFDRRIVMKADDVVIWDGIVPKTGSIPMLHTAGIPPEKRTECTITISGEPYSATLKVDWRKGNVIIAGFSHDGVNLVQTKEPVRFL